jgi:hypothetical protein
LPNKHVYFALGATHGVAVVAWVHHKRHEWFARHRWMRKLYRWDADWFLYFPFVIAIFGLIALVPDILLAFDLLPKELIRSNIFNVFYGYAWLEQLEDREPAINHMLNILGSSFLYLLSIAVLAFYAQKLVASQSQCRALKVKATR